MVRSFFIGLQFLTRICIVKQDIWTEEDFGRSVQWFPLVGAVLGTIYGAVAYFLFLFLPGQGISVPRHAAMAVLLAVPVLLTGGLHCDGFMDTVDGVFSGRSQERMLEIMKDSRVGANGVCAFVLLMFLNWGIMLDMEAWLLVMAMFVMPVIGRFAMTMVIVCFPYARPEGIGKAFAQYATKKVLLSAGLCTAFLVLPWGPLAMAAWLMAVLFAFWLAKYIAGLLGGVTGDVYGAVELLSETVVLFSLLLGAGCLG